MRTKIEESLGKALTLRNTKIPSLRVFRFLSPQDLTAELHLYLQKEAQQFGFEAESWGDSKLLALLALHPHVATVFPEFLLPAILEAIRGLQTNIGEIHARESLGYATGATLPLNDTDQFGLSATFPDLYTMQRDAQSPHSEHRAYEYWRAWVYSPSLALASIDPLDEDYFCDAIRDRFVEDRQGAEIEDRSDGHVAIGHAGHNFVFHRRWARWIHGTVGMAVSIREYRPNRQNQYSLADIAVDFTRFLRLASDLARESAQVQIRFEFNPGTLRLLLDASDERVRQKYNARLAGVTNILKPELERPPSERVCDAVATTDDLIARAHQYVAEFLTLQLRHFHKSRVDTKVLAESIPSLLSANVKVLAL